MPPVPVQFEERLIDRHSTKVLGVCGTCTHCGKSACAPVDSRKPATSRKEARAEILAALTGQCEERLPWGVVPHHADRGIPRGVSVYAEDHEGLHWPLWVDGRRKLNTVAGGCAATAVILVVPESDQFGGSAEEFAIELQNRGYKRARKVAPWAPLNLRKKAEAAS